MSILKNNIKFLAFTAIILSSFHSDYSLAAGGDGGNDSNASKSSDDKYAGKEVIHYDDFDARARSDAEFDRDENERLPLKPSKANLSIPGKAEYEENIRKVVESAPNEEAKKAGKDVLYFGRTIDRGSFTQRVDSGSDMSNGWNQRFQAEAGAAHDRVAAKFPEGSEGRKVLKAQAERHRSNSEAHHYRGVTYQSPDIDFKKVKLTSKSRYKNPASAAKENSEN